MNGAGENRVDRRRTYTNEELFDMILIYGEFNRNSAKAARQYALRYPDRRHPTRGYIHAVAQVLRRTGSFHPTTRPNGIVRQIPPARVDVVRQRITENPHTSIRTISRDIGSNKDVVQKIIRKYLGTKPWKRRTVHKLQEDDFARRKTFCDWIVDRVSCYLKCRIPVHVFVYIRF